MVDRPAGTSGGGANALGRYHLGDPLGGGPTGEVFRAKVYGVAGYERQYAVKRFHPALALDPAAAELLASAARAYATVTHPHIARLAEYGVAGGQSFVAVELVNGVDLPRLLAGTTALGDAVPRGALLGMMVQCARALAYAHARGVVHGGLAPTNVVVSSDGDPKVTDFGFLRARLGPRPADDPTLAARLPYLAPEQLDGMIATPATDVFVLAALTVEVLTGERAFPGKSPAEIAAALRAAPREQPDIPPPVWEVLRQAFAPLEARFANGGAFADALDAAVKKLALPGGRTDVAAAVKRVNGQREELLANASGAVSFPLPAPPPSTPGVSLAQLFPGGAVPRVPPRPRTTLQSLSVPPPPPPGALPVEAPAPSPRDTDENPPIAAAASAPTAVATPVPVPPPMVAAASAVGRDPPSQRRQRRVSIPPPMPVDDPGLLVEEPPRRTTRWPIVVLAIATLAGGGYLAYDQLSGPPKPAAIAATRPDAQAAVAVATTPPPAPAPVAAPPPDAAPAVAVATTTTAVVDAAAAAAAPVEVVVTPPAEPDAAVAVAAAAVPDPTPAPPAPAPDGKLLITSKPSGALVFLDGAPKGKTPLELAASNDRHKLAVMLPGYKLVRREVDGHGAIPMELEPAPKLKGPAGIKVHKCAKNRYYVIVDGDHTGMVCPTERINVALGDHAVEIYDAESDETTAHQVPVRDTHSSVRVSPAD